MVYGGFGKRRVGRRAHHAGEDLVPHAVGPAVDLAVAGQPLLLRAVDDERQLRVGDEAAAGVLRPGGAVVHQRQVAAADVDPAHRHGLARPPRSSPSARQPSWPARVDVDGEVGQGAPEVDQREAVARAAVVQAAVVDLDLAVDRRRRRATRRGRRPRCSSRP